MRSRADTLEDLAARAGIDPEGLVATMAAYNDVVASGKDPLGRTHRPAPVAEPPFYALENHPVTLITFAGLDTDEHLRVRREDRSTIDGLYAVGEVIGSGGGERQRLLLGHVPDPALAFGRIVGRALTG